MTPNINFTPSACNYIKTLLEKQNGIGFRLSVKKTGCSGYSYVPEIIQAANPADISFEVEEIKIFIDKTWLHLLQDVEVNYVEEEKSGLKQKRLMITSTKESGRCGCGESFHIS